MSAHRSVVMDPLQATQTLSRARTHDADPARYLARYLGHGAYPATGAALLTRLRNQQAPAALVDSLSRLSSRQIFYSLTDVYTALGVHAIQSRGPWEEAFSWPGTVVPS